MHAAVVMSRSLDGWSGQERDLDDVEDLDSLADELRDDEHPLRLLFIEEDDEWVGIIRVEPDADPRVFLSDRRALETSELAERLFADALPITVPSDDADDEETARPNAEPVGEDDVLADQGTPGDVLVQLCASEGMLPADVISELCERAGCTDALDQVRH